MGCLTQAEVTDYQAKADRILAQLQLLYTAFDQSLTGAHVDQYRFDSGDGSQMTKNRDPEKLEKLIRSLESRMEWYLNKIAGKGISVMNFRRDNTGRYILG